MDLIERLDDARKAGGAAQALVNWGEQAVPHLLGEAFEGDRLPRRGWVIVCLARIGGKQVDRRLAQLHANGTQPWLVRTWAAAARVRMAGSAKTLRELAELVPSFPALGRPIGKRLVAAFARGDNRELAEPMIEVTLSVPALGQSLAPAILALGRSPLVRAMVGAKNSNVRRQAAAYVGALAIRGEPDVPEAVVAAYRFTPGARTVPWDGGPLFLPRLSWRKKQARALVGELIRWHLWCDLHGRSHVQRQIYTNLCTWQLASAAGFTCPGWRMAGTDGWLSLWGGVVGKFEIRRILAEQGVLESRRYAKALLKLE